MKDAKVSLEQMVTGSFVKYNVLNNLIQESYSGSNANHIHIFIDLNSLVKPLYSIDAWSYKYNNKYELAASILNMCAHYRKFFSYIGVYANIYLIYGLNNPNTNATFVKGYNQKFMDAYIKKKDTTEMIYSNLNILSLLCEYITGVYYFDIGSCEVSSMIYRLIDHIQTIYQQKIESLIISKDILALQLIPLFDSRVLRPHKTKNGDESFIVDNSNMWNKFCTEYRDINQFIHSINTGFISNILAMTRVPERSIYSILSIPQAYNIIYKALEFRFLDNNKIYTQSGINTALEAQGINVNLTELEMRFKCINPQFQSAYVLLYANPEYREIKFRDLDDKWGLQEIVSKYFSDIPIELLY